MTANPTLALSRLIFSYHVPYQKPLGNQPHTYIWNGKWLQYTNPTSEHGNNVTCNWSWPPDRPSEWQALHGWLATSLTPSSIHPSRRRPGLSPHFQLGPTHPRGPGVTSEAMTSSAASQPEQVWHCRWMWSSLEGGDKSGLVRSLRRWICLEEANKWHSALRRLKRDFGIEALSRSLAIISWRAKMHLLHTTVCTISWTWQSVCRLRCMIEEIDHGPDLKETCFHLFHCLQNSERLDDKDEKCGLDLGLERELILDVIGWKLRALVMIGCCWLQRQKT